jgi:hypothetical protein
VSHGPAGDLRGPQVRRTSAAHCSAAPQCVALGAQDTAAHVLCRPRPALAKLAWACTGPQVLTKVVACLQVR